MKRSLALLVVLALIMAPPVTAHHRDGDQTARIVALEAKVANLEARVAALEAAWASPAPTPAPPSSTAAPTTQPTATIPPTPAPTAVPSPAPTPAPTAGVRRFPLPVTTATYPIPTTIDSTGTIDVSGAVQAWVNSVPNGSVLSFRAGGIYRLAGDGILLDGRSHLIFEGNGATLLTFGSNIRDSGFVLGWTTGGNSHITIRGFVIQGDNPDGATERQLHFCCQSSEGLASYRNESFIEFAENTVRDMWGHGVYFGTDGHPTEVGSNVWVHDNLFERVAIYGVVFAKMDTAWVERNTLRDVDTPLGFEDGAAPEAIRHVYMGHNILDRWSWEPLHTSHAISGDGSTGVIWDDIIIDSNVLIGGDVATYTGGGTAGLISFWGSDLHTNLRITDNRATFTHDGWAIRVNNAPGVVVSGNDIPLGPDGVALVIQ